MSFVPSAHLQDPSKTAVHSSMGMHISIRYVGHFGDRSEGIASFQLCTSLWYPAAFFCTLQTFPTVNQKSGSLRSFVELCPVRGQDEHLLGWDERCRSLKGLRCICCRIWRFQGWVRSWKESKTSAMANAAGHHCVSQPAGGKTWKQGFHSFVGLCVLVSCLGLLNLSTHLQLNVTGSWTFKIKCCIFNFLFRVMLGKGLVSNAGCSSLNDSANKNPG